ncbi:MAG: hypothetical protein M3Z06_15305 [Actinomycetota bacterium]|nr:hypothetical protein [Actinomycetota bacterium]
MKPVLLVQLAQRGLVLEQFDDIPVAECPGSMLEVRVDRPDQRQIGRVIDRPALVAHVALGLEHGGGKSLRTLPDEGRNVLAIELIACFGCGCRQRRSRKDLCVEAVRVPAIARLGADRSGGHGGVEELGLLPYERHQAVDDGRIDQRAVGGDPHHSIGTICGSRGPEAVEHIMLAAPEELDADRTTEFGDLVVAVVRRGEHNDLINGPGGSHPFNDAQQGGFSGNVSEDFARKSGRAHTGLDEGRRRQSLLVAPMIRRNR